MSIINCLIVAHSVFSPKRTKTASITICTAAGGLAKPLIYVMSFLFNLLRAYAAASKAGKALFNSPLASSSMILIYYACILAISVSSPTTAYT